MKERGGGKERGRGVARIKGKDAGLLDMEVDRWIDAGIGFKISNH